ncbi:HmuY family protein [Salmonirosea aquatica]|uniref:HmuY family protein n=1 Tax=Salmonirosea aquatica TaxID=2654236 RepID=A0A7C9BH02_9BACT|nr:hypothetical protein [Cytophagaceae bacterium SJW1-29]
MNLTKLSVAAACLTLSLVACDKSETIDTEPVKAETVKDIPADPPTGVDASGRPTSSGKYTFFSFQNGIVPSADSASMKWDLALKGTTLLTNGGASGPGQGGAVVLDGIFDETQALPASAAIQSDTKALPAIPTGSGKGWYSYDPQTHLITPTAGKVIVVRTADGKYAKMEILSYYKGAPTAPTQTSESSYYTLRYVYQPDGTPTFTN